MKIFFAFSLVFLNFSGILTIPSTSLNGSANSSIPDSVINEIVNPALILPGGIVGSVPSLKENILIFKDKVGKTVATIKFKTFDVFDEIGNQIGKLGFDGIVRSGKGVVLAFLDSGTKTIAFLTDKVSQIIIKVVGPFVTSTINQVLRSLQIRLSVDPNGKCNANTLAQIIDGVLNLYHLHPCVNDEGCKGSGIGKCNFVPELGLPNQKLCVYV